VSCHDPFQSRAAVQGTGYVLTQMKTGQYVQVEKTNSEVPIKYK